MKTLERRKNMLKKMKNKTYRNFIIVMNKLMKEKGYGKDEAAKLTHMVFDNLESDCGYHSVQFWYDMIMSKADYEREQANGN
jgi:hypothetical protein